MDTALRVDDPTSRWATVATRATKRLLARQRRVVVEKLTGAKARRGTRHFITDGEAKVTRVLSVDDAWDDARWLEEFAEELSAVAADAYDEAQESAIRIPDFPSHLVVEPVVVELVASTKAAVAAALDHAERSGTDLAGVVAGVEAAFDRASRDAVLAATALAERTLAEVKHGDKGEAGYELLHPPSIVGRRREMVARAKLDEFRRGQPKRRGKVRWRGDQEPYYRGIEDSYWRHRDELEAGGGGEAHRYAQLALVNEGYPSVDIFLATQDHGDSPPGFTPYEPGGTDGRDKAVAAEAARTAFLRQAETVWAELSSQAEEQQTDPVSLPEPDKIIESVVAQATGEARYGELSIRVPTAVVNAILRDGRIKNQFETGTSRGTFDPGGRARMEKRQMNVPEDTPAELRPVYGYLEVDDYTGAGVAKHYGEVLIVLKRKVRERTTVTWGDSLGGRQYAVPLRKIDDGTATDDEILAAISPQMELPYGTDAVLAYNETDSIWDDASPSHWTENDYLEAQIHGGVSVADIEGIYFPPGREEWKDDWRDQQATRIEKMAKELGIHTGERDME